MTMEREEKKMRECRWQNLFVGVGRQEGYLSRTNEVVAFSEERTRASEKRDGSILGNNGRRARATESERERGEMRVSRGRPSWER